MYFIAFVRSLDTCGNPDINNIEVHLPKHSSELNRSRCSSIFITLISIFKEFLQLFYIHQPELSCYSQLASFVINKILWKMKAMFKIKLHLTLIDSGQTDACDHSLLNSISWKIFQFYLNLHMSRPETFDKYYLERVRMRMAMKICIHDILTFWLYWKCWFRTKNSDRVAAQ